jgi:hypothetical protein
MAVSQADLDVYQGDDYSGTLTVYNSDGTPATITGYTALAQIRRAVADQEPTVAVTIATTIASPNVNLSIPNAQTKALSGQYVWDLQLTSPGNVVMTVVRGKVNLTLEVSRLP